MWAICSSMEYEYMAVYKPNEERPYGIVRRDAVKKFVKGRFETRPVTALRALEIIAEMVSSTIRVEKSNS